MTKINQNLNKLFNNYQNTQNRKDVTGDGKFNSKDTTALNKEKTNLLKQTTVFDANGDGKVTQEDLDLFVKGFDIDGDGKISAMEKNFAKTYLSNMVSTMKKQGTTFTYDNKTWVGSTLANGIVNGKYYKSGVLANGTINGKMYQSGVLANGTYNGLFYQNGVPCNGTITSGSTRTTYENGLATKKYYKNSSGAYVSENYTRDSKGNLTNIIRQTYTKGLYNLHEMKVEILDSNGKLVRGFTSCCTDLDTSKWNNL